MAILSLLIAKLNTKALMQISCRDFISEAQTLTTPIADTCANLATGLHAYQCRTSFYDCITKPILYRSTGDICDTSRHGNQAYSKTICKKTNRLVRIHSCAESHVVS